MGGGGSHDLSGSLSGFAGSPRRSAPVKSLIARYRIIADYSAFLRCPDFLDAHVHMPPWFIRLSDFANYLGNIFFGGERRDPR